MQTSKEFNSALAILQKIIKGQGEKILNKPIIVKGYMWDYKDIYTRNNDEKSYGKWVQEVADALEIQAAESLQNSSSENISQTKKRLVLQLRNRYYVEEEFAIEAVDLICSALNISETEPSKRYQNKSDQKSAYELNQLGNHYYYGEGVEINYNIAFKYYEQAAEQGYAVAQNALGICYCNGNGIEQSWIEAARCFKDAADQDYAAAQCNLGNCYYYGNGVEKNRFEAVQWFKKAADQDIAYAQNKLGECYRDGEGIGKDYNLAEIWFQKAANQKLKVAQRNLKDLHDIIRQQELEQESEQEPQQQPQQEPKQQPKRESKQEPQQQSQQEPKQQPKQEFQQEPKQEPKQEPRMSQNDNEEEKAQLFDAENYYRQMLQKGFSVNYVNEDVRSTDEKEGLERFQLFTTPWSVHGHNVQASASLRYKGMEVVYIFYDELFLGDFEHDITERLKKRKIFLGDQKTGRTLDIDDANALITEMIKKTCRLPYVQDLNTYMEIEGFRAKTEGRPAPSKQMYLNSYLPQMESIIRDPSRVIIGSWTTLDDLETLRRWARNDT